MVIPPCASCASLFILGGRPTRLIEGHRDREQPAPRRHRGASQPPRRADPRARRGDGDDDPASRAGGAGLPRRAVRRLAERPARQQRPPRPDRARRHRRDPPRVPRRRRRPARDEHLQRQRDQPARLRHGRPRLRDEPRRRADRPHRVRRDDRAHPRPAALRRRCPRPDQQHGVNLPRRRRPGQAQHHLRPARRRLPRAGARPRRRRRGPAAHRDDLRHPQREGGDLRLRDAVRGVCAALAGHHLGHHHGRLRSHPVGAGHRGVLQLDPALAADRRRSQLRSRRGRNPAVPRRDRPYRRVFRVLLPERGAAQRVRRVRRDPRADVGDHGGVRR